MVSSVLRIVISYLVMHIYLVSWEGSNRPILHGIFYSVLIILSVFQTDWCSGGLRKGAQGGGRDDGSTTASSLSSCAMGLCRPRYNIITSTNRGLGWKR